MPRPDEDVGIGSVTVNAPGSINVKSLHLIAATLHIGDKTSRPHIAPVIDGDLTLVEGSKLYVYAGELTDMSVFKTAETDRDSVAAALWANKDVVEIRGEFLIEGGSAVYPDNAPVSGVPVAFIADSVTLSADSKIDVQNAGWKWVNEAWTVESGAKPLYRESSFSDNGYTYAFGAGSDYRVSASYGGKSGGSPKDRGGKTYYYNRSYGTTFAPFLPGSPGGIYALDDSRFAKRAPGSAVIYSAGMFTLEGKVVADGVAMQYFPTTGGGIWLATGAEFAFGEAASLSADTGNLTGGSKSSGGRIALSEGVTLEQWNTLAKGTVPEGFNESTEIVDCAASVKGGTTGSLSFLRSVNAKVRLTVVLTGNGSVTFGEETHTESFVAKVLPNTDFTLSASAAEGSVFASYVSSLIALGESRSPTITLSTIGPATVQVNFASLAATSRAWSGGSSKRWSDGTNWTPAGVPGPNDSVTLTGGEVEAPVCGISVSALTLDGATLKLGDKTGNGHVALTVAGGLTLTNGAKLYAYAGELADMTVYQNAETDRDSVAAALWANREVVQIGGAFQIGGASTVWTGNSPVSGVPVAFIAGSVSLAEDSKIVSTDMGWKWVKETWTIESGAKPLYKETAFEDMGYTYAFGVGSDYRVSASYGGASSGTTKSRGGKTYYYNRSYGTTIAPFLSGSPGGIYALDDSYFAKRAPGAVVVYSAGAFALEGKVVADGTAMQHFPTTGGGIWLATGTEFAFGEMASLSADMGNLTGSYKSSGGRIALSEGITLEQWDMLAKGTVPEGFNESPEIVECAVSVQGGTAGSLSFVRPASSKVQFDVVLTGAGSVTLDGETYDASFTVKIDPLAEHTLTATAASGSSFLSFVTALAEGGETAADVFSFTTKDPATVYVNFVSDTATARAWNGAVSSRWSNGANWTPAGVPGPNDTVTVSGGTVESAVRGIVLDALTVDAQAKVTIGSGTLDGEVALQVRGDLTVAGGAVLTVAAREYDDLTVFDGINAANSDYAPVYAALWEHASRVLVGGDLLVTGNGSKLRPRVAITTGVPVVFRVDGDVMLGEGASFDAVGQGWGWHIGAWGDPERPLGAKPHVMENGNRKDAWTLALGAGFDYNHAAGYGHAGEAPGNFGDYRYGRAYGFDLAPFLPGSPSGWYSVTPITVAEQDTPRGGGAINVFAKGKINVFGTVNASGHAPWDSSGSSGGGIWLVAEDFAFGASAKLLAKGGDHNNSSFGKDGGGGRIAVCRQLKESEMDSLARTGKGMRRGRIRTLEQFQAQYPGVEVSVVGGHGKETLKGTFVAIDARPGLMLLVK